VIEETTTIREGLIKRIHIDQHRIKANLRDGTDLPVVTVQARGGPYKGHEVSIDGPSQVIYRGDDPLSCGARVWIESKAPVTIQVHEREERSAPEVAA